MISFNVYEKTEEELNQKQKDVNIIHEEYLESYLVMWKSKELEYSGICNTYTEEELVPAITLKREGKFVEANREYIKLLKKHKIFDLAFIHSWMKTLFCAGDYSDAWSILMEGAYIISLGGIMNMQYRQLILEDIEKIVVAVNNCKKWNPVRLNDLMNAWSGNELRIHIDLNDIWFSDWCLNYPKFFKTATNLFNNRKFVDNEWMKVNNIKDLWRN